MTSSIHIDFQKVRLAFIGGGNMASAILGGLIRQGLAPKQVVVIEPFAETATNLQKEMGVEVHAVAGSVLAEGWVEATTHFSGTICRPFHSPPCKYICPIRA